MSAVRTDISYEGTERGAEQIDALLQRLGTLVTAEERAAVATNRLEGELGGQASAASRSATETLDASRANQTFTVSAQGMATRVDIVEGKMEAFGSAVGALGGAMQGISPELDALGTGFGHLSAAIGTATAMPGPLGLAMAGLTLGFGAYSAATAYAEQQTDALRETAEATIPTLDDMISRLNTINTERARQSRVDMGLGTAEEQAAALHLAEVEAVRLTALAEGTEDLLRARAAGTVAQRVEAQTIARDLEVVQAQAREARAEFERMRQAQHTQSQESYELLLEDNAGAADEDLERQSPRRSGGQRENPLTTLATDVLTDLEEYAARAQAVEDERLAAARYQLETEQQIIGLREWAAEQQAENDNAAKEAAQERYAQQVENLERLKDKEEQAARAREDQSREIQGRIESTLTTVAGAYLDAFGKAIEGQQTLEEASLEATKSLLKMIGQEMVGIGIRETLEGFANIVSNPPVAATKIPMGIALIAGGVAFGAAGAAIPSAPSVPAERPRSEQERGGGEGSTFVLNVNSPMISAGTQAQLARQFGRQMRDGAQFPQRSLAA